MLGKVGVKKRSLHHFAILNNLKLVLLTVLQLCMSTVKRYTHIDIKTCILLMDRMNSQCSCFQKIYSE